MSTEGGWLEAPLAEITTKVGSGATPKGGSESYTAVGTPLIRSMNVHFAGFKREGLAFINDDQAAALSNVTVQADDVLLNITGASIGRATIAPADLAGARVNQHVSIIRTATGIDPRFIAKYLASPSIQALINDEESGATRQALTKEQILGFSIPVPPEAEQRRIVAKLDAFQSRTRLAREALAAIPALLDHYRQSVLAAAFRGELTSNVVARSEAPNPDGWDAGIEQATWAFDDLPIGWSWMRFDQIADDRTDSRRKLKTDGYKSSGKYPVIDQGESTIAGWSDDENLVQTAKPPYVLFGDHTRKVQPVSVPFIQGADGLKVYKATPSVLPQYLAYLLRGISIPDKGYSRHAKFITAARYPVAPLESQQAICDAVERAWTAADKASAAVNSLVLSIGHLDQSLLATAFRGELVPQDPADEPASALLDRIRAARAQVGDVPRTRRGRPASSPTPRRAAEPVASYQTTPRRGRPANPVSADAYATLLAALRKAGSLANADAQAATGLDAATVRPLLQRLVAEGHAHVEGQKRGTRYVVT